MWKSALNSETIKNLLLGNYKLVCSTILFILFEQVVNSKGEKD